MDLLIIDGPEPVEHQTLLIPAEKDRSRYFPVTFPRICLIDLFVGRVTLTSQKLAPFYHLAGFPQRDR